MKTTTLLLFLFYSILFSEEICNAPYLQASKHGDPSSYIQGCVSVISGCYLSQTPSIIVKGREPIDLTRYFASPYYKDPRIEKFDSMPKSLWQMSSRLSGWDFFDHLIIHLGSIDQQLGDGKTKVIKYIYRIQEPNGPTLIYSGVPFSEKGRAFALDLEENSFEKGLTNCSTGQISARLNCKNNRVMKIDGSTLCVIQANGGKRLYKAVRFNDGNRRFILREHTKASGNKIFYDYTDDNRISEIKTTNQNQSKTYAWAKFTYSPVKKNKQGDLSKHSLFSIKTSDKKEIFFRHESMDKTYRNKTCTYFELLKEIYGTEFHHSYEYETKLSNTPPMLQKIKSPTRTKSCGYYFLGTKNKEYGIHSRLERKDDKFKRVIALKSPIGKNNEEIVTHKFIYNTLASNIDPGTTWVIDNYSNVTIYKYNDTLRLEEIKQRIGKSIFSMEKFCWADPISEQASFIRAKTYFDGNKTPIFSQTYNYDNKGNVVRETFYGNLTGKNSSPLVILPNNMPLENGVETHHKTYIYTQDDRNLILEEIEYNGLIKRYSYINGTDILKSIFTLNKDRILKRQFYEYDQDLLLSKKIEDDGSSELKSYLTDVTQRKITAIQNKQTTPFIGMPETIEEKYFNLKSQKEKLLSKVVLTYDDRGFICQKDLYDANNTHVATLTFKYNAKGDLLKETNCLEQQASYSYDEDRNKIFEIDFTGKTTEYTYDLANRLVKTEIYQDQSLHYITNYEYNNNNFKIKSTDPRGQTTHFKVDAFGHVLEKTDPSIPTPNGDLVSPIEKTSYSACGNPINITSPEGNTALKEYNIRNQATKTLYPNGAIETNEYHPDGMLYRSTNPEGVITEYTYDVFQRKNII